MKKAILKIIRGFIILGIYNIKIVINSTKQLFVFHVGITYNVCRFKAFR